jgi:ABC-type sugar transport system ATPase subunit
VITALRLRQLVFATPAGALKISLQVDATHLVAAVAGPGAGTGLARVVAGLAAPVSGRIQMGERDVTELPPVRRQIGYVPAGGALLPHLTVRQNIEYGLRRRQTVYEVTRDWVSTLVERLELTAALELRPHVLSDSQRLRTAIARAAACLPEALVMDLPRPLGGAERLRDLVPLASPEGAAGVAVLVCSADPAILEEIPQRVRPEDVGGP